jgi:hypothetical protein
LTKSWSLPVYEAAITEEFAALALAKIAENLRKGHAGWPSVDVLIPKDKLFRNGDRKIRTGHLSVCHCATGFVGSAHGSLFFSADHPISFVILHT